MDDLLFHLGLFLAVTAVIVAVSCMFTEAEDGPALRLFPRRYFVFVVVSAAIAGVMLVLEHTLASVA